ncbi:methylaspartate mutase [Paractinoplanes deccanensis]|nr:methylaspartate mutase [Actinoplanes deccanensis]
MGMGDPAAMAAAVRAVAALPARTAATITLDSYTRVGDHRGARRALAAGERLNGFPLVAHGPAVTARVADPAGPGVPVQVRHGSARPGRIFATMATAGLCDTEGGPVSYCLPYGRIPLAESVACWAEATEELAAACAAQGLRAHLETFGGCLLGQLSPPSLLVAMSVLEALFFARHGITSVSLSYAQQTDAVQDVEALAALRHLAGELLPAGLDWHVVLYTYMGVYPRTAPGAWRLLGDSAEIAVSGGAERLIVKTVAEAHRIATVGENLAALVHASRTAERAYRHCALPRIGQVDYAQVLDEARALIEAVLGLADDVGRGLLRAFAGGLLDVPFCLHRDNRGLTRGTIDAGGRLVWAKTGRLPLPASARPRIHRMTSTDLLSLLSHVADRQDGRGR